MCFLIHQNSNIYEIQHRPFFRTNEVLSASTSNLSSAPTSLFRNRRGSDSSLPTSLLWASQQQASVESTDNETEDRINANGGRRGSKLLEFLEKKKVKNGAGAKHRYKDKQGFVWRRMLPNETFEEDLPRPRAPHLGHGATPWLYHSEGSTPLPSLVSVTSTDLRKISAPSDPTIDNTSLTSFKTCPSDSNILPVATAAAQRPKVSLPIPTSLPQPHQNSDENVIAGVRHLVRHE